MNITSINIQEKKPYATGDELCMRECSIVSEVQSSSSERKKQKLYIQGQEACVCMSDQRLCTILIPHDWPPVFREYNEYQN